MVTPRDSSQSLAVGGRPWRSHFLLPAQKYSIREERALRPAHGDLKRETMGTCDKWEEISHVTGGSGKVVM